jgi:hypothetical protein
MRARGGHVEVGQRIQFGYVEPEWHADTTETRKILRTHGDTYVKRTGADVVEAVDYIIAANLPLNMEHYMHQKMKGLPRLLRSLLSPVTHNPHDSDPRYARDEALLKKHQDKVAAFQDARVAAYLFAPAEAEYKRRRWQLAARLAEEKAQRVRDEGARTHGGGLHTYFTVERALTTCHVVCTLCRDRFETTLPRPVGDTLCAACTSKRSTIVADARATLAQSATARTKLHVICEDLCIASTGFGHLITPEDCTKHACPIYQQRDAADLRARRANARLRLLAPEHVGGRVRVARDGENDGEDDGDAPARQRQRVHVDIAYEAGAA